jgi:hypothetical protein
MIIHLNISIYLFLFFQIINHILNKCEYYLGLSKSRDGGKVQVIQKSNKFVFLDIFTWFDRARRALQNGIFRKNFKQFFSG